MTRFILRSIIISTLIFPVEAVRGKEIIGPYVANQFYPADPKELNSMLDSFLEKAPKKTYEGKLLGAMVPHAGYIYSGSTAAEVYKLLEGKTYKTVILLGTGHHYGIKGAATITRGVFRTPLGDVPINTDLAKHLIHLSPLIENNLKPYKGEHSIEVQIPFLQKVLKKFTLVPLLLNTQYPDISQAVGKAVSEIAKTPGVLILVSTDLSHYPDKDTANLVDSSSLKALPPSIEDPLYFWLTNRILLRRGGPKLGTTYCGEAALLAALFAFKELEANQTVLVSYTNSGMLENGDPNKAVGYAAVLWTKNKSFISDPHPLTFTQKQTLLKLARQSIEDFLK
ncbi:MAG: AmmeMemoRadiSam system protein B, partial [Elusimicrobia bacterium]|nr:AmmeMemoRadiSam system protein B [Elusimicrobiota bacterium]